MFFHTWRRQRWPLPGLPESLGMKKDEKKVSSLFRNVPILPSLEVSPFVFVLPIVPAAAEAKPCEGVGRAFRT
jgi:hypothetical protein